MKKTAIFSLYATLLFMLWQSMAVESANTSEAKFTGAMQNTDQEFLALVEDEDTKSGWSIKAKRHFTQFENENSLWVYFHARTDPKADFKEVFIGHLCYLLEKDDETKNFLPKDIAHLIFTKQNDTCQFQMCERPIRLSGQVRASLEDNEDTFLPEKTPYQLEVRIVSQAQAEEKDISKFLFKVSFDIGGDINHK